MKSNSSSDALRSYLKSIGRVPRLTHEEEVVYGNQVKAMMPFQLLKKKLTEEFGHQPSWTVWASQADIGADDLKAIVNCGDRAKFQMVSSNLRLVVSVARKYRGHNLDLLDLIQEGTLGLTQGIEKFDPAKGFRLSTYAYWWIRQAITRAIAMQSRTIRLPIHITETINSINRAQRKLTQSLGRMASIEEIAEHLDLTPTRVRECLSHDRLPLSLIVQMGENSVDRLEFLEAESPSPEDFATQNALRSDLESLMELLPPRQKEVLILRFGFQDGYPLSLAQVAIRLNMSRERVRQLEKQAVFKLKKHRGELKDYLVAG